MDSSNQWNVFFSVDAWKMMSEGEWTLSSRPLTTRIKEILWEKGITKVVIGNWVNVVQGALGQQI